MDMREPVPLAEALDAALGESTDAELCLLVGALPHGERDRVRTLLHIYDLHTAPVDRIGDRVRFQHHPVVAQLKRRCEQQWLGELTALVPTPGIDRVDPVAALRAIAARNRLPTVYKWLARDAAWSQVVQFLTLEGGPDAGFDDLVAAGQVGLRGAAKLELATNYWDEMGGGELDDVHTHLHDRLVAAVGIARPDPLTVPTSALARSALCGLLVTNRSFQPELLGALGLIELQAGPRCRLVLQAFDRCEAPRDAYPFYEVHADVDPRHGRDWLANVVAPVAAEHPAWAPRIVTGALWRDFTNTVFFDEMATRLRTDRPDVAA